MQYIASARRKRKKKELAFIVDKRKQVLKLASHFSCVFFPSSFPPSNDPFSFDTTMCNIHRFSSSPYTHWSVSTLFSTPNTTQPIYDDKTQNDELHFSLLLGCPLYLSTNTHCTATPLKSKHVMNKNPQTNYHNHYNSYIYTPQTPVAVY